jgi:serine/threonine-protein kinase
VVLYELLTGERMFQGEDAADTLATIIHKQPDLERAPVQVRRLLEACLQKDPKLRLRDIGDARPLLEKPAPLPTAATPPRLSWLASVVAVAMTLAASVLGWIAWRATRPVERPLMQLNVELAPPDTALVGLGGSVTLSPDGQLMAATIRGADGERRLATRRLDQSQFAILAHTEGAVSPHFSPDSQWIAFLAPGGLEKIPAQGGTTSTLCDSCRGPFSWGDDGNIVLAGVASGLSRVSWEGGALTPLTQLDPGKREWAHRWPQVLPGSQQVLFTVYGNARNYDDSDIDVVSVKTGERKTVYKGGFFARYLPSGHLIFIHQNTLFAVPFDLKRLALAGPPQPVVEDIRNQADEGGNFDFSQSGTFIYLNGKVQSQRSIFWLDNAGRTQPLESSPGLYTRPQFSPDGKRLAFYRDDGQGHTDIFVKDLEHDTTSRLTSLPGRNGGQTWTQPDGKGMLFVASNPAAPGIYWIRSDGSGEARRLGDNNRFVRFVPVAISPDGKWLAGTQTDEVSGVHIVTAPLEGDSDNLTLGRTVPFVSTPFITIFPNFSPDGRWVAYMSNEPGKTGIWVRPFPGPGGQWQIDSKGNYPIWSRSGHELFYLSDRRIMVAEYSATGATFAPGKPRLWSDKRLLDLGSPPVMTYDVAPDGKRFAVILYTDGTAEEKPVTQVTFLLNFFDELRRRVPVGK